MCLYPSLIKNKKYTANKKNAGIVPPVTDPRTLYVPIGCQKCIECMKQKARAWQIRLLEEIKTTKNGKFITLTFSNESITQLKKLVPEQLRGYDIDNAIATIAMRRFLERWRKRYGTSLRHWTITELGNENTEHLHIHGIIWPKDHKKGVTWGDIEHTWGYGFIWKGNIQNGKLINYVNGETVSYITKYVTKIDELHKEYKPIILTTKGIGKNYTTTHDSKRHKFSYNNTNELYRTTSGHKIALPTYYRNKLYTDHEREILWLIRLDKEERFVCGEKVSIKKETDSYYRLLNWHRKRNDELGYGNNRKNWQQIEYEQQRREMKIQERETFTLTRAIKTQKYTPNYEVTLSMIKATYPQNTN